MAPNRFRWPPDRWLNKKENRDRPYDEVLREWYELHPEQGPPLGWSYSEFCLREADLGHPEPLIGRFSNAVKGGPALTAGEIQFIIATLRATTAKRGYARLREAKKMMMAMRVETDIAEGASVKRAVINETVHSKVSEKTVYNARAAYRKLNAGRR